MYLHTSLATNLERDHQLISSDLKYIIFLNIYNIRVCNDTKWSHATDITNLGQIIY